MTRWYRIRQALFVVLSGSMLLQTTAGCEEQIAPLIMNLVTSLILNALLGGLAT